MLYRKNIVTEPSEIGDGNYYATVRFPAVEPAERIICIYKSRIYDGLTLFDSFLDYDIRGPVPSIEELESLCQLAEVEI